jgi:tRNA pseudouridine38-40 synthase
MRYFIEFSYNGSTFFGYQIQPNEISVQEELEKALSTILRTEIKTTGAGRTDTGVHAKKMFAHFDFDGEISEKLVHQLNSFLPPSIAVKKIFEVKEDFHARFSAKYRTYEYYISLEKNPFSEKFAWQHWRKSLDVEKMNEQRAKFSLSTKISGVLQKWEQIIKPIFVKSITQIGNKTEMNLNLPSQQIDFSEIWFVRL